MGSLQISSIGLKEGQEAGRDSRARATSKSSRKQRVIGLQAMCELNYTRSLLRCWWHSLSLHTFLQRKEEKAANCEAHS